MRLLESKKTKSKHFFLILGLCMILILSIIIAISLGSTKIAISDIARALWQGIGGESPTKGAERTVWDIVWYVRFPRVVLALAVGIGLSVSGAVMQAVIKNPLADPYVLGVSSGASLGATVAILFGVGGVLGTQAIGVSAFIGAFSISLVVLLLANVGGKSTPVKLLLIGMALSAVCSAFSNFAIYMDSDADTLKTITYWLMGSLASAKWSDIAIVLPIVIIGTVFFWTQSRTLNLMLLGDDVAITLGTSLNRRRGFYLLIVSVIIGFVVYSSGIIGFVGLIIPHAVRMLVGSDHRKLIPISALAGGCFLIWSDVLCRILISRTELPIGIITAMIGAPCFIWLMVRKQYGFGGKES